MKTVFFRADGSQQIGLGHIMRCQALATGLQKRGYEATFITRRYDEGIIAKIRAGGFSVHFLPPACSMEEDRQHTLALIRRSDQTSALIIDWYALDAAYQRAVKEAGTPLVVIDDLAQGYFSADAVLNQNLYAAPELYSAEPYTRLLLGPSYALLREEFAEWRRQPRSIPERARHILVTLGGADPDNQTLKVVQAIAALREDIKVIVVVGFSYPHRKELARCLSGKEDRFTVRSDVSRMAELIHWADLAVSAGGTTCWELACLGVPNVIVTLADNQERNGLELEKAGSSVHLGWCKDVPPEAITTALRKLIHDPEARRYMSQVGQRLVDGEGVDRVIEEIKAL
jgi:UDP-2,4-diacetamido-2,4,6-trideoxy-beta-L-altropyranose hydrolase